MNAQLIKAYQLQPQEFPTRKDTFRSRKKLSSRKRILRCSITISPFAYLEIFGLPRIRVFKGRKLQLCSRLSLDTHHWRYSCVNMIHTCYNWATPIAKQSENKKEWVIIINPRNSHCEMELHLSKASIPCSLKESPTRKGHMWVLQKLSTCLRCTAVSIFCAGVTAIWSYFELGFLNEERHNDIQDIH